MSAVIRKSNDQVSVQITGKLSYTDWQTLRNARNAAQEARCPLAVEVQGCDCADMGGLGSIMIAQERLGSVEMRGCSTTFARCLKSFGICAHCTAKDTPSCGNN